MAGAGEPRRGDVLHVERASRPVSSQTRSGAEPAGPALQRARLHGVGPRAARCRPPTTAGGIPRTTASARLQGEPPPSREHPGRAIHGQGGGKAKGPGGGPLWGRHSKDAPLEPGHPKAARIASCDADVERALEHHRREPPRREDLTSRLGAAPPASVATITGRGVPGGRPFLPTSGPRLIAGSGATRQMHSLAHTFRRCRLWPATAP